jgi:hypothetical protein
MSMTSLLMMLLLGVGIASASTRNLAAQDAPRVQVALVDSLSTPTARAELVRFASPERPPLILLRSAGASPADLATALATLERARTSRSPRPGTVARVTILGHAGIELASPVLIARADRILRDIAQRPYARIGNLGRGRWGEFDVPR